MVAEVNELIGVCDIDEDTVDAIKRLCLLRACFLASPAKGELQAHDKHSYRRGPRDLRELDWLDVVTSG
jgi:hypothetical protein